MGNTTLKRKTFEAKKQTKPLSAIDIILSMERKSGGRKTPNLNDMKNLPFPKLVVSADFLTHRQYLVGALRHIKPGKGTSLHVHAVPEKGTSMDKQSQIC